MIPEKYILSFHLDGIEVHAYGLPKTESDWSLKTGFLQMIISNEINSSDILFDFDDLSTDEELAVPLTERIKNRNDLVAIALINEQGDRQTVYVDWGGDDEYTNETTNNRTNSVNDVIVSYVREDLKDEENAVFELFDDEFVMEITKENHKSDLGLSGEGETE